jgi:hypothetical protein
MCDPAHEGFYAYPCRAEVSDEQRVKERSKTNNPSIGKCESTKYSLKDVEYRSLQKYIKGKWIKT